MLQLGSDRGAVSTNETSSIPEPGAQTGSWTGGSYVRASHGRGRLEDCDEWPTGKHRAWFWAAHLHEQVQDLT